MNFKHIDVGLVFLSDSFSSVFSSVEIPQKIGSEAQCVINLLICSMYVTSVTENVVFRWSHRTEAVI